ncbi:hypothetical protein [Mucilaginibacter sp. BT774]|uniref:hypothetical protein n=1 Tax=Mucilaginibacter sp. BT774 TaxID=3062276 RepID=UPI002676E56B|nr:hypothetical protein [Mucilaginibacter sp. BT774]MDO3628717.1 hypothetical protein [Mucilaginibacter sp. BT774]
MQRRTFIHLSAYTALALTLPFADGCSPSPENIASRPFLFSQLADKKTIAEAGIAYRKKFPKEDDKTLLSNLLIGANASLDKSAIEKQLDDRVLNDFRTGKTIMAAGWVLSVTEARQCALYSILNA